MSNYDRDRVEVFALGSEQFRTPVPVGSEPWGLDLSRDGDTLLVGNSGGTNVSNVFLGDGQGNGAVEDGGRRLLTPDVLLFELERKVDATGIRRYIRYFIPDAAPPGFSDRPQFLAVDSVGLQILKAKRRDYFKEEIRFRPPVRHLAAAEKRFKIGTADLSKIEIVKLGWEKDILI